MLRDEPRGRWRDRARTPESAVVALFCCLLVSLPAAAATFPEIAGWSAEGQVQTYGPDTLWESIDGAADQYLAYGFKLLQARNLSSAGVTVTVNVYDMGTDLNAFGIFQSERPAQSPALAIGAGAVVSPPYQCLLVKGSHYVKVDAYEGEISASTGRALVEAIAAVLPGSDGLPEALQALPGEGMVEGTAGFTREGYLGLAELIACVHATYRTAEGAEYQIFHLVPAPGETPKTIWTRLSGRWIAVPHDNAPILSRRVPYRGLVGLILGASGIYGVADAPDKATMIALLERAAR